MSPTREYAVRIVPEHYRVFGAKLRPFSVGHAILLHRISSPFAGSSWEESEKREPGLGDLLMAVWICSRSFESASRFIFERKTIARRLKRRGRFLLWLVGPVGVAERMALFQMYLAEARSLPEIWVAEGAAGRQPGAPWLAILKVTLMHALGISRREALDTPLAEAQMDVMTWRERRNELSIISTHDRNVMAEVDKLVAEGKMVPVEPMTPKETRG